MSVQFSSAIPAQARGDGRSFTVQSIDLRELGERASPVVVLDDFRVRGRPFPPHPHAGFSAVTYVFEDSPGSLRTRTSLGNDIVVGPGGIVWTQAGSGVIHEEMPAESGRELHGLQVFVNLSAKNKLAPPQLFHLASGEVPELRNVGGDRVRVAVGSFGGRSSPLVPVEPFTLLEVELRREISFNLGNAHNALVYVRDGNLLLRAEDRAQEVTGKHALALFGGAAAVRIEALQPARFLFLSGAEIREPVLVHETFIMNDWSQLDDAMVRYRAGAMGHLAPYSDG
jgi:redox-sensitive bicupin YhaK (pirin superfamily)